MTKIISIRFFIFAIFGIIFFRCTNTNSTKNIVESKNTQPKTKPTNGAETPTDSIEAQIPTDSIGMQIEIDSIVSSKIHKPNYIFCELDGDNLADNVKIVQNLKNKKYGLKIIFGNSKVEYLGMGQDVLKQGFDDLNWIGIFEIAPKGQIYFNNVNDDGEIISEDQVKEKDKIKLHNDGIYIHQTESCGGGVIYFEKGKFEWIQQE